MDILAVGDFFNLLQANGALSLVFVPALGNTFMLGSTGTWSTQNYITNAVGTIGIISGGFNVANESNPNQLQKVFINNTNYIELIPNAFGQFICGIQVS